MNPNKTAPVALVLVFLAPLLSGCARSSLRLSPEFGIAVNQDIAAQIADPDAHYSGTPAPGSNGPRVGLAQKRYDTGTVIPPSSGNASAGSIGATDNGQNGGPGGGGSGGAGAGVGVSQ